MKVVSRIKVMESYASVFYENVGQIMQISKENYSDDNSKQLNYILKNVVELEQNYMNSVNVVVPEGDAVFPHGYYAYTNNEELWSCAYSIKIEYNTELGAEVMYLYYLGQDE